MEGRVTLGRPALRFSMSFSYEANMGLERIEVFKEMYSEGMRRAMAGYAMELKVH